MNDICGQPISFWVASWRRILSLPSHYTDAQVIQETRYYLAGMTEVLSHYDAELARLANKPPTVT